MLRHLNHEAAAGCRTGFVCRVRLGNAAGNRTVNRLPKFNPSLNANISPP